MRSLNIALFALATLALASAAVNSSYTCVGNPYFTAPYNPNPVNLTVPSEEALKNWNVTYNSSTQVYDFSDYKNLSLCKDLATTGSCCSPDVLNENAKNFGQLVKATGDATVKLFEKRANALKNYGKVYGKIISSFVNLVTKIHNSGMKLLMNANKLGSDLTIITKLLVASGKYNATSAIKEAFQNGTFDALEKLSIEAQLGLFYDCLSILAGPADIGQKDLAEIFGSIKSIAGIFMKINEDALESFNPFVSVDSGVVSDATTALKNIFNEISSRNVTLKLDIGSGATPKKRRLLSQVVADAPSKNASPKGASSTDSESEDFAIPFPLALDSRNIEVIAGAILKAIGNATNATETFKAVITNNATIYKAINDSWVSDIKSVKDIKRGGDWKNVRTLLITLAKLSFDDSLKKVVALADHKKKCLNVVFKYQGYIGCLACDASAVATGKVLVNATTGTFAPVVSESFGLKINENCAEYFNDLVFMKGFLAVNSAFDAVSQTDEKARKNPKDVDTDISKINMNVTKDGFNISCPRIDGNCTWIQKSVVDKLGVSPTLLCDFTEDECDALETLKNLRNPFANKTKKSGKRLLAEADASGTGDVVFVADTTYDVSSTEVGFSTEANYTVDASAVANVTVDSTQENNTEDSNSTNTTNTSNSTNSTGKFGLKALVSIPLILATIFAFLL